MDIFDSKLPDDCALTAVSNFFGVDYMQAAKELDYQPGIPHVKTGGTPAHNVIRYCERKGLRTERIPCVGWEKATGLVVLRHWLLGGHVAVMIDGVVLDTAEKNGKEIRQYCSKYGYSIHAILRAK